MIRQLSLTFSLAALVPLVPLLSGCVGKAAAGNHDDHHGCRNIRAHLVEDRVTTGCLPGETACFLGTLSGGGLHATTHFRADSVSAGPPPTANPGWINYSGLFEYTTSHGTLAMRETGVSHPAAGHPESGAVTAHQQVMSGTGDYAGATGHLFVSGFNIAGHVETQVFGEICLP
jgi:hypothetical protein